MVSYYALMLIAVFGAVIFIPLCMGASVGLLFCPYLEKTQAIHMGVIAGLTSLVVVAGPMGLVWLAAGLSSGFIHGF